MSSRVLSGSRKELAEPLRWMPALGEAVNSHPPANDAPAETQATALELEAAHTRIAVLERRIQELEAELPRRYQAGVSEGRAAGEAAGATAATAKLQPMYDRLSKTVAEVAGYRARLRRESEPELLRLALAVAKKILRRELTVDPHALLGILKAALETINNAEILLIRVAPDDVPLLAGRLTALGLPDRVEVAADRGLERGSVIVETQRGQIDASVQTQLAEIENGFADRIATP